MAATAHEIRRVLKMYDNSSIVPVHQAIAMLTEVTKLISEKPEAFDLTSRDAEVWAEAGGLSYSENDEFPSLVGARWLELLSKPGVVTSAGFDKDEWGALLQKLTEYEGKLVKAELSMEVLDELTELITKLREQAPEPDEDSEEDDDDEDD